MIYVIAILLILIFILMLGSRSMALQRLAVMELIVSVIILAGYVYAYQVSIGSMEQQYMTYIARQFEQSNEIITTLDDKEFTDASKREELAQWMETAMQEALPVAADGKYYLNAGVYTESTDGYNRIFFIGEQDTFDEDTDYQKQVYPLMNQVAKNHSHAQVVVKHEYGVLVWADSDAAISRNVLCVQIPITSLMSRELEIQNWFIRMGWILWGVATILIAIVVLIQNQEWKKMIRAMSVISSGKEDWKKPKIYSNEMQTMWNSLSEMVKNTARSNYEKYRTLRAYYRFAPKQVERILERSSMAEVATGDFVNVNGIVALAKTAGVPVTSQLEYMQALNQKYTVLTKHQKEQEGILISGDSDLQSMKFLFLEEAARVAAFGVNSIRELDSVEGINRGRLIIFAHRSEYLYGVAGDEEQAMAFLASNEWKVLERYPERLLAAGVRMVVTDSLIDSIPQDTQYRYLGYVGTERTAFKLYEILDACPGQECRKKLQADSKFQQGIRLFYKDDFYLARNAFSDALKECPEDRLIKWYLFTCEHHLNHPEMEHTSYELFHEEV